MGKRTQARRAGEASGTGADAGGVRQETQGRTSKTRNTRGKELEAAKFSEGAQGSLEEGEGRMGHSREEPRKEEAGSGRACPGLKPAVTPLCPTGHKAQPRRPVLSVFLGPSSSQGQGSLMRVAGTRFHRLKNSNTISSHYRKCRLQAWLDPGAPLVSSGSHSFVPRGICMCCPLCLDGHLSALPTGYGSHWPGLADPAAKITPRDEEVEEGVSPGGRSRPPQSEARGCVGPELPPSGCLLPAA